MTAADLTKLPQPAPSSDAVLLSDIARGNLGALGAIYDRYHADVWRVLNRLTAGAADVDDLVQATFLELPRLASTFDGRASCRAWLCSIAAALAARHRRGVARFLQRMAMASFGHGAHSTGSQDPEREACAREELRAFERALRKLPWKKREAFVLVEMEGLSIDEAARVLAVPTATVRTRLFHARRELRRVVKRSER